jgi:hypothetical protein
VFWRSPQPLHLCLPYMPPAAALLQHKPPRTAALQAVAPSALVNTAHTLISRQFCGVDSLGNFDLREALWDLLIAGQLGWLFLCCALFCKQTHTLSSRIPTLTNIYSYTKSPKTTTPKLATNQKTKETLMDNPSQSHHQPLQMDR